MAHSGATRATCKLCQVQTGPEGLCGENCTPCVWACCAIRSISQGPPQYFTSGITTSYKASSNTAWNELKPTCVSAAASKTPCWRAACRILRKAGQLACVSASGHSNQCRPTGSSSASVDKARASSMRQWQSTISKTSGPIASRRACKQSMPRWMMACP